MRGNRLGIILALLLLTVSWSAAAQPPADAPPIRYGIDSASALLLDKESVKVDYGSLWIGPWNLARGWRETDQRLDELHAAGVTPYIQFYYWGDEMGPACLESGCISKRHGVEKNMMAWDRLGFELTQHLNDHLKGAPVVIVLETEFNKEAVATYEPLDMLLAQKAAALRAAYPAAIVVLGFGNWGHGFWANFDQAAAAADAIGVQAMRASTRHTTTQYGDLAQETVRAAQLVQGLFHKPIHITDIALSSYPDLEATQNETLAQFLGRLSDLQAAGVQAIVYRDLFDQPAMDTSNYFGAAEKHWGLRTHDGRDKPAFTTWRSLVAGPSPDPLPATGPPAPTDPLPSAQPPHRLHLAPPAEGFPTPPIRSRLVGYLEAEALGPASGALTEPDQQASRGAFQNMTGGATLRFDVSFPHPGDYEIRVRAQAGGPRPPLLVLRDGDATLLLADAASDWTNHGVVIHAEAPGDATLVAEATPTDGGSTLWLDAVSVQPTIR